MRNSQASAATPTIQESASTAIARPRPAVIAGALAVGVSLLVTCGVVYYLTCESFKLSADWIGIGALSAWSFLIWRLFGRGVLWVAWVGIHATFVFMIAPFGPEFGAKLAWTLLPPALAYWLCLAYRLPAGVFAAALSCCLCADLWGFARSASFLYERQPSPAVWGADLALRRPAWPRSRFAFAPEWLDETNFAQAIRYPELVEGRAYALAPPMARGGYSQSWLREHPEERPPRTFAQALRGPRWTSFLLTSGYFRLVHSTLPPAVVARLLAIDAPLFQLKSGAVVAADGRLPSLFSTLAPAQAAALLDCTAVVAEVPEPSWQPLLREPEAARELAGRCRPPDLSYSVSRQGDSELELDAASESGGVLYWSDGYDPRWRAFVDGRPAPIARAGLAFKALLLPPGRHRLRLVYDPLAFRLGLWLHYLTFAGLLVGAWLSRISRARSTAPA